MQLFCRVFLKASGVELFDKILSYNTYLKMFTAFSGNIESSAEYLDDLVGGVRCVLS